MKLKRRYLKWIENNIVLDKGITIAVTGSTSGIGKALVTYLSLFDITLLLIGRNKQKLSSLKEELKESKAKIQTFNCDFSNKNDVLIFLKFIQEFHIDIFFNNAGIYHQPIEIKDGLDKTFTINFLIPILIAKTLFKVNPNCKVINTSSISYRYHKFDRNDIQGLNIKNKTKRYGYIKRLLMMEVTYLNSQGYSCLLAHPGICKTGLFSQNHKTFNRLFYIFVSPIMSLIFMKPSKASLSLLYAASNNASIPIYHHVGPKGVAHVWGYPSIQKIKNLSYDEELIFLNEQVDQYIRNYFKMNVPINQKA